MGFNSAFKGLNRHGPHLRLRLRLRFLRFVQSVLNPKFNKIVDRQILTEVVQQLEDMKYVQHCTYKYEHFLHVTSGAKGRKCEAT
jgi:hypothetical protein